MSDRDRRVLILVIFYFSIFKGFKKVVWSKGVNVKAIMDFSCTVCDLNFLTKGERKIHILSDKHQSNARRRLKVTYGRIRETSVLVESKVPMMPVTAGILELMEQLPRITGEDFAKDFIISATTPTKAVWILSDM